jgi:HJR/Mrr/RecB family endonuclease
LDASSSSDTEQNIAEFEAEQQKAGTSQVTEEKKKEIERELSSIHSEFERIDYSTTGIAKVENILDNIESRLESLMQEASEQGFDELKTEAQNLEQEISNRQAREEKKKEIEKELDSIRSDLYKIDSLVTDGEYQKAEKRVDKIKSAILSLKKQVSLEKFDSLENKLQRLERKCDKRLSESHVLTQIRKIDPYEFEEFVAKIWEKQGWDAEATTGSADRGVDVVATKEDTFEKRRHLIQVKRHGANTKVGSEDIQRYASLYQRDEQVDNVFVVTSNQFTSEAEEVANRRDVSTVNGNELYEMLTET